MAGVRVLAVDDDPEVATISRLNLELVGHEFLWAPDGVVAVDLARHDAPDVVLLDTVVPPAGGVVVLTEVRRLFSKQLPVILFTAEVRRTYLLDGLRAGAITYVTKPFGLARLLFAEQASKASDEGWVERVFVELDAESSLRSAPADLFELVDRDRVSLRVSAGLGRQLADLLDPLRPRRPLFRRWSGPCAGWVGVPCS